VNALPGDRQDALIREQELLDGAFRGRMAAKRGIAFELGSIEGGDATLYVRKHSNSERRIGKRTHMVVTGPQQLLGRVESER
jgi:hypothetical protein